MSHWVVHAGGKHVVSQRTGWIMGGNILVSARELHRCKILLLLNMGSCCQIYLRPSAHDPVTHLSSQSFGTAACAAWQRF